jgi:phosphorylcholine metabolism protein LicD
MTEKQLKFHEILFDLYNCLRDQQFELSCGTALGFHREGGFIEWDNDIDIFVERTGTDFNKIIENMSTNFELLKTFGNINDGFEINFVALLNWVIINNIDVFETGDITYNKFLNQSYKTKWYVKSLSYDNVPKEELDITNKLISNLINIVDDSKLNFRKLNSDFITSALASKIKSIMLIPDGTKIKCCKDEFSTYGNRKYLTKGNYYEVKHSYISNGFLKVRVIDDMGMSMTCGFDLFEDIQLKRSNILDQLFGL